MGEIGAWLKGSSSTLHASPTSPSSASLTLPITPCSRSYATNIARRTRTIHTRAARMATFVRRLRWSVNTKPKPATPDPVSAKMFEGLFEDFRPEAVNTKPDKPRSDRNRDRHSPGYMRDYMRRRRATQRADKALPPFIAVRGRRQQRKRNWVARAI